MQSDPFVKYQTDGFVLFERYLDVAQCKQLKQRATTLASQPDISPGSFTTDQAKRTLEHYFLHSGDKIRYFYEESVTKVEPVAPPGPNTLNKIGHALHALDPLFARFTRQEKLGWIIRQLDFTTPGVIQSMLIFKAPNIGSEVRWHQDATFLHTEPVTVTGFWIALDDADEENGCLWMIPGAHQAPLTRRLHRDQNDHTHFEELSPPMWDTNNAVPLCCPTGSVVMFHGKMPHFSKPNRSDRSRNAYTFHVIDLSSSYSSTNWLQHPQGFQPYFTSAANER